MLWRPHLLAALTALSPDVEILCGRNFDSPLALLSSALLSTCLPVALNQLQTAF